jgi:hypothetical protein
MARGHGRILTSIWEDEDFLALDQPQQRLYLFLISQPNLNHAGLLDLTLRRWSRKAAGLSVADLDKLLMALEHARFVVVDDDTEELLIRSFVRNDGVWRMPKVMGAMVSGALEISSPKLRLALLAEMDRIPLCELSDDPTKTARGEGPSIRAQVTEHIDTLRRAFGNPNPDPNGRGSRTPSATPSGTPSDTPDEGGREASTRGRAGAHVHAAPALSPSPAPTPAPEERGVGEPDSQSGSTAVVKHQRSDDRPAPIDDDGFEVNDAMRRWAVSTFGAALDIEYETAQFVSHFRADGGRRRNWPEEWKKWLRRSAKYASDRQQTQVARGNVVQLPTGQTLTGTDAKVAGWMAIAEQLRQEGDPA